MNRILEVCLIALATSVTSLVAAQSASDHENPSVGQEMQRGISVQMPLTNSAAPEPDADEAGAKVVTVTENGDIDFGVDPITPGDLAEKLRRTPFIRGQKLYIKADARTPYSRVLQVLEATRNGGISPQVLLTQQSESPAPGKMVPPKGLPVQVGSSPGTDATVVQVLDSGKAEPALKVNSQTVSGNNLQSTLSQILQNKSEKVVQVRADGRLPFAQVVHVIDACRSTGAKTVLLTPEL